jgi:hypothetical protein
MMRPRMRYWLCAALATGLVALSAASADAASPTAGWTVDSIATPTDFSAEHDARCLEEIQKEDPHPICDIYEVEVRNAGSKSSTSSAVTVLDSLPKGVTAQKVELYRSADAPGGRIRRESGFDKSIPAGCTTGTVVRCELTEAENLTPVAADATLVMFISVTVEPSATSPLTNTVTVSGGGAPSATTSQENPIASTPPPFGPANFDFYIAGRDGAPDTLAGDHPYEVTTTIDLNNVFEVNGVSTEPNFTSVQYLKDVVVDLPLGFAGSTLAAPQCTLAQLSSFDEHHPSETGCPSATAVGHITTEPLAGESVNSPIWNLVPERGVPAEFGYIDEGSDPHVLYARPTPSPSGYVLQVTNVEIPEIIVSRVVVSFFGDPAERANSGNAAIPFFTNPTACTGTPLRTTIWMDSWQHPGSHNADGTPNLGGDANWVSKTSESPPVTGCEQLSFGPELFAQPSTHAADSPSGLDFELKLAQPETEGVRATPAQRNATVVLPEGITLDPSAANGLAACSVAQIGWGGGSPVDFSPDQPECPEASKLGTLEVTSPLIAGVLSGSIYLARQNENPFGSVLAGYVVIDDPVTGVILKVAGELKTDPRTGRITGVFDNNPQLPFSDLKLHFFGGARGGLATPESCGAFTVDSALEPWSAPASGPDAMPFDSFQINENCGSGFSPTFTAGATKPQAGAYSPFVASFSRSDGDQELAGATVSLPPGLAGNIKSVPLCPEVQANAGTCPESTQIGTVQAAAGPGPDPIFESGKAYLTGPYNGGPYGMSVVVPAVAGPFNFGNVIVRQSLRIDPTDAHVTDVSDPFPTILDVTGADGHTDGVPIRLRRVDVSIDRPSFTLNPTNCATLHITASLTSTLHATAGITTPFQAANCAALKFAPVFTASSSGHTSKEYGASLTTKLTYPPSVPGTYANVAKVKVDLPLQLPSRLTTLHGACLAAVFNANPSNCPARAIVGHAKAIVPILPLPLEGPAYFVSHGGEAFPSLTMVLQGNGITIDLVGSTLVRHGITSTTFRTLPDSPVSSFELTLPESKNSALGAIGNLCKSKLTMPTAFVAQNGTEIHRSTRIVVTGCKKNKSAKRAGAPSRNRPRIG